MQCMAAVPRDGPHRLPDVAPEGLGEGQGVLPHRRRLRGPRLQLPPGGWGWGEVSRSDSAHQKSPLSVNKGILWTSFIVQGTPFWTRLLES